MTTITQVDSAYSHAITKSDNIKMITENLRELLNKMALDHPNHVAYIFEENGGLEMTYAELKRRVEQTARNLQSLGFVKGDILAFMFPYTVETLIITFACSYIGVISAPLDPWWCVKELEHALEIINPKGLILLSSLENVFYLREFKKFCPAFETSTKGNLRCSTFTNLKHVILARKLENYQLEVEDDSTYSNAWDIDEILLENPSLTKDIKIEWPELNPHDPWFIVFTSGTTGRKKGSYSTFYKFINNCQIHLSYALSNSNNQDVFDNFCYTMSLNFIGSQLFGFLPALVRKTRTIIPGLKRGNKAASLKALEKYKCTSLMASPKHLFDILNGSNFELPSLRYILAGSQTVTIDLIEQSFERFKLDKLFIYYGMTEILISSVMVIDNPKEARMNRKDDCVSVGRPLPFYEFKVVDLSTKSVLPFDTPGELYVNSFANFNGYWRNEEKTKEIIGSDQWLRTGDLVKMDSDGYIYHKNRVTESIEFGDMTIFPSEVESALRTHENVADASVFSIKTEHGLDLCGCAWVILKDKTRATSIDELRSVCGVERGMIEHIKFVNDFPTSENGKIVKIKMASLYKQELNIKT